MLNTNVLVNQDIATKGHASTTHSGQESEASQSFQALLAQQMNGARLVPTAIPMFPGLGQFAVGQSFAGYGAVLPGLYGVPVMPMDSLSYTRITAPDGTVIENFSSGGTADGETLNLGELLRHILEPEGAHGTDEGAAALAEGDLADVGGAEQPAAIGESDPSGSSLAAAGKDVFNTPDLGRKIGDSVADIAARGGSEAEFTVNDPNYGRIEAAVKIDDSRSVEISFGTQDPALSEKLASVRTDVESALQDSGFVLAQFDVVDISHSGSLNATAALDTGDTADLAGSESQTRMDSNLNQAILLQALDLVQS